jgi:hypothetical protein
MKVYFQLILSLFSFPFMTYCQNEFIDFENPGLLNMYLTIDTVHYNNNTWQIGTPDKSQFHTAKSPPNVIVTDTTQPYPVCDTSVFVITNPAFLGLTPGPGGHQVELSGYFFVDSDSLKDYGYIEFSPDNGITWINFSDDTLYSNYYFWYCQDSALKFTGRSNGWSYFFINISALGPLFNIQLGDTVCWRFTFISDSLPGNFDGLMFDDLNFVDIVEGVDNSTIQEDKPIIFPNPITDFITLRFPVTQKAEGYYEIIDPFGAIVVKGKLSINGNEVKINASGLKPGHYSLVISLDKGSNRVYKIIKI